MDTLIKIIVTFGFIGRIPVAPGTFGSLAAFPLLILLHYVVDANLLVKASVILPGVDIRVLKFCIMLLLTLFLFIIGTVASELYIQDKPDQDPSEVVIDEVVGQLLTSILCLFGHVMLMEYFRQENIYERKTYLFILDLFVTFILPFILFRIFDISKPWPIDYIDKNIKGGLGIMLDDVLAAIFASVSFYALLFNFLKFNP